MIRPANLALLARARRFAATKPELLARFPVEGRESEMSAAAFNRLMDFATVYGFADRRRPILSLATRQLIDDGRKSLGVSDHLFTTLLRESGAAELRDLGGVALLYMLGRMESAGFDVVAFNLRRRSVTPKQMQLVHVARDKVELSDLRLYRILQQFGGVNSASDLDARGFDLVMTFLESEGFQRSAATDRRQADLGSRPGFASPDQLGLIRELWREWSGNDDEGALAAWLERFHRTSALRFLTVPVASKVITGLKAMKRRKQQSAAA